MDDLWFPSYAGAVIDLDGMGWLDKGCASKKKAQS